MAHAKNAQSYKMVAFYRADCEDAIRKELYTQAELLRYAGSGYLLCLAMVARRARQNALIVYTARHLWVGTGAGGCHGN